ncbi:MAG: hypothetical protein JO019_01065 [Candidatus Kaiserbacteria bacterium]|nr:hypothetical protein [Candidatus Kaiserbacteria bacterium]
MQFCTKPDEVGPKAIAAIVTAFTDEPHLLPITPADIEQSLAEGLALVVIDDGEAVGFTRLIPLGNDFYELGSTWVHRKKRGKKLNHQMYGFFLPRHRDKNILATTTNPVSLQVGEDVGMALVNRKDLPASVWRSTCSFCPAKKILAHDAADCRLAWNEPQATGGPCWVRVTAETAARLGIVAARIAA